MDNRTLDIAKIFYEQLQRNTETAAELFAVLQIVNILANLDLQTNDIKAAS